MAAVIADLKKSPFMSHRIREAMSRIIILDFILFDRLNRLSSEDAFERLMMSAEVPVSIKIWEDGKACHDQRPS